MTPAGEDAAAQTCLTIGNFDGVHTGHKYLIELGLRTARDNGLEFAVMTFWPHPRAVLQGPQAHQPLTTHKDRLILLARAGARRIMELPFNRALASLTPEQFASSCLKPLNVASLVVGHDFTLGKDRAGNIERLEQIGRDLGISIIQAPAFMEAGLPVSSTRLRRAITTGDMTAAARMLGRPYEIAGKVAHGFRRGSKLGFPTANLAEIEVLLPPNGVYATMASVGGRRYPAVTNIGFNPTFGNAELSVESFLLDADLNLYDKEMRLEFISRIRQGRKFSSPAELGEQIGKDIEKARQILSPASH